MDQLLASTSFGEVHQIDSPWFSSRSPRPNPPEHPVGPTHGEYRCNGHPSRHQTNCRRLSSHCTRAASDCASDLSDESDIENLRRCATSFLFAATLTSQEQNLFLPLATTSTAENLAEVETRNCRGQPCQRYMEGAGDFGYGSPLSFDSGSP
jgi:hypothetical protein